MRWAASGGTSATAMLILIYRKPDAATLQLVRLGSHSELGF